MSAICYDVITVKMKGVTLIYKIKELEKLVAQLNKLTLRLIEWVGTITLLILAVKGLIESL